MSDKTWKEYTGGLAVPTLVLIVGLATLHGSVLVGASAGWIPLPLATALLIPISYGWFTPLHEAAHGNIGGHRSRQWIDTLVGWGAALAFVAPYPAFQAVHLRHHGTANREGRDPDHWVAGQNAWSVAARCLAIVPHYYWMFARKLAWESAAMRQAVMRALVGFTVLGAVAVGLVWAGAGIELVALWLLPGWLASGMLAFAFDWFPHHPHGETGRWTNARVVVGGPVLTMLLSAQNYHLVHHLWPRVPFYRYPELFRRTRPLLEEKGSRIETWV